MVDENELCVIHYTLGPLKPWDWWTSWLVKPVDVWQNVRKQLKESLPGTGGGRNPNDDFLVKFLSLLPFCAAFFCCYRLFLKNQGYFGSFCRSSPCDYIRHLYYRIKSGGPLAYASISSSMINSSHQVNSVKTIENKLKALKTKLSDEKYWSSRLGPNWLTDKVKLSRWKNRGSRWRKNAMLCVKKQLNTYKV